MTTSVLSAVLRNLHQHPIAYYLVYAKIMGSAAGGLILSQVLFYFGRAGEKFARKDEQLIAETGCSIREFREAKKTMKTLPFLKITVEGMPAETYYEVLPDLLFDALGIPPDDIVPSGGVQTSLNDGVQTSLNDGVQTGSNDAVQTKILDLRSQSLKPEKEKNPPDPPQGGSNSQQVLAHLSAVTGRRYSHEKYIQARLASGATVDDCCLVIDWLHTVRRTKAPEWVDEYLNPVTPFRAENFDKYLPPAREWEARGRVMATPQSVPLPAPRPTPPASLPELRERTPEEEAEARAALKAIFATVGITPPAVAGALSPLGAIFAAPEVATKPEDEEAAHQRALKLCKDVLAQEAAGAKPVLRT